MTDVQLLDDILQTYRSSAKWVQKKQISKKKKRVGKKTFKTPVKLVKNDEDQYEFPNKQALFGLPPQIAFNLACILTKKRRAFQLDSDDTEDNGDSHSVLVEKIKQAAKAIKPELAIETFNFSALGRGTSRSLWTIFWIPSLLSQKYIKYAVKLKQVENMPLPVLSFDADFEDITDEQLDTLMREEDELEEREILVYTLIGKMLDIKCPVQYFLSRGPDSIRVIFYVRTLFNVHERHEFKAQMCVHEILYSNLSQFYTELLSFTKLGQSLDMIVSMEFLPLPS